MKIPINGKKGEGKYIEVDDRHYTALNEYSWSLHTKGYAVTHHRCSLCPGNWTAILVHQVVTHLEHDHSDECVCTRPYVDAGLSIDHINADKLDNRVENLQYVHKDYNNSKAGLRTGCSSGYNGVGWRKDKHKWQSYLQINGKLIHLGFFDDEKEAALAYNRAVTSRNLIGERFLNTIL